MRLARLWREAWDWRTLAAVAGVLLMALLIVGAFTSDHARRDAIASQRNAARTTAMRISALEHTIAEQTAQIARQADEIGSLHGSIAALEEQVRRMGGQPISTPKTGSAAPAGPSPTTTTTTAPPRPSPTVPPTQPPRPSPTTTTTTRPCTTVPVVGCVP